MGRRERKSPKRSHGIVIALVSAALVLLILALVFLKPRDAGKGSAASGLEQGSGSTDGSAVATTGSVIPVTFPLVLEDGKLEIENVFQFVGFNPDCGDQEGDDIASITVKNTSDTYLERADITLTADDGQVLHFSVTCLPAGKTAMAFSQENALAETDAVYGNITCEAVFDTNASMNDDKISVSIDGSRITLRNKTGKEITELIVYCRCTLGDQYFGGITYTYTVNNLAPYGTAEVDAVDCILGMAEVVRISVNES